MSELIVSRWYSDSLPMKCLIVRSYAPRICKRRRSRW